MKDHIVGRLTKCDGYGDGDGDAQEGVCWAKSSCNTRRPKSQPRPGPISTLGNVEHNQILDIFQRERYNADVKKCDFDAFC